MNVCKALVKQSLALQSSNWHI